MSEEFIPGCEIKVDGTDVTKDVSLLDVTVEQSVHLPSMFVIRIADPDFSTLDKGPFLIGGGVVIKMADEKASGEVTAGEITAVEMEVDQNRSAVVTIRGYDKSHRLHRGRKTRAFLERKDSDIASSVVSEAGLASKVDSTTVQHEHVWQANQTDWEFLRERAARVGYELFFQGGKVNFVKPTSGQQTAPAVEMGKELLSLRVQVSSAFQANEVQVKSWDAKSKKIMVGSETAAQRSEVAAEIGFPSAGSSKSGAKVASEAFSSTKVAVVNRPVDNQDEAKAIAKAVYTELDGAFVQAEGEAFGDPRISAGRKIEIKNAGERLSGKYYITSATHFYTPGSYRTNFVASGRQTNSLLEILQGRSDGAAMPGVVAGIVTNNNDPENIGRVKVKYPWLDDDLESGWMRVASPGAGPKRGFFFVPEVNDEVLVAFEHGDINRPFVVGGLWNDQDEPPERSSTVIADGNVNQRIIRSRQGHEITLHDKQGEEKISIVDKTGKNKIEIDSKDNKISIEAEADVVVDAKANVQVKAGKNVEVNATSDITVKASGNANVEASGNVKVKATGNAAVEATGNLDLKGMAINIQATGTTTIKGAMVNIN